MNNEHTYHDFADMREVSVAARFRVAHREAISSGGLGSARMVRKIDALYRDSPFLYRCGRWRQWYQRSFAHNLEEAVRLCAQKGITLDAMEATLDAGQHRPRTRAAARLTGGLQRNTRSALCRSTLPHPEVRLRQKLEHWLLPLFPCLCALRSAADLLSR